MNPLKFITENYQRNARLYPALIVLFPIVLTLIVVAPASVSLFQTGLSMFAACGGIYLTGQLARDAGSRKEAGLFARWGGMPSVAILRHSDTRIDEFTKARYHRKLTRVVEGTRTPTPEEETADPALADKTYHAWSTYVRVHTRDTKEFNLLYKELTHYGFRRNLWGLRPVGIASSLLLTAATMAWIISTFRNGGSIEQGILLASGTSAVFLLLWLFQFSTDWVRLTADAYATRLAEAIDKLPEPNSPATTTSEARPTT